MKTTVSRYDFERAFVVAGRKDQFSYEGLSVLFDYLEQYEEDTGQEIDLDVVALCCDYTEDTPESIAQDYRIDLDGVDDDDTAQAVMDYLCNNTTVVGQTSSGSIIYVNF